MLGYVIIQSCHHIQDQVHRDVPPSTSGKVSDPRQLTQALLDSCGNQACHDLIKNPDAMLCISCLAYVMPQPHVLCFLLGHGTSWHSDLQLNPQPHSLATAQDCPCFTGFVSLKVIVKT